MKFKLVLLAMVSAALLATGTASAFMTAPPPGAWKSLTMCLNGNPITLQSGQYLRIGWGSLTEAQSYAFVQHQYGTVTIESAGVVQAQWLTGDTSLWTQPELVSAPGNKANGGRPLWFTGAFFQVNLPPGSYTITAGLAVSRTVFDGSDVYKANSLWFVIPLNSCALTVT